MKILAFPQNVPSQMYDRALSAPLSLQNDKPEIKYTYTDINKNLEKLSNKNLTLLLSSYCPLTGC